jgi:hypothetical protein
MLSGTCDRYLANSCFRDHFICNDRGEFALASTASTAIVSTATIAVEASVGARVRCICNDRGGQIVTKGRGRFICNERGKLFSRAR